MSAARIDSLLVAISVGEDLGSTMLTSTLNQKSLLTVMFMALMRNKGCIYALFEISLFATYSTYYDSVRTVSTLFFPHFFVWVGAKNSDFVIFTKI
jgi:hypothetical protein